MRTPRIDIDLDRIEHNARTLATLCAAHGIAVAGVSKVVCGLPAVAAAMIRGGVTMLGDSRLANLRRLRESFPEVPLLLLRLPALSAVEEVVALSDISLNSDLAVLEALSAAAVRQGREHRVILMVELGDLREGALPAMLPPLAAAVVALPGLRLVGLGTNLACFGGVIPTREKMAELVAIAEAVEAIHAIRLEWLSGINSSGLDLIAAGAMPSRVNHARLGEAILLGRETTARRPWPGLHQDAFVLHAEVLELYRKPSQPQGELGEDAFGHHPHFAQQGERLHALLNLGREDVEPEGLTPLDAGVQVLGATSGYLVLDVTVLEGRLRVGDSLAFFPNYAALLRAMTSEYVTKRLLCREVTEREYVSEESC